MMLSVDADVVFAPENVERLIDSTYAFVGTPYPFKTEIGNNVVGTVYEPITRDDNGFVRARDVGSGFCLLRREVFERLSKGAPKVTNDIVNGDGKEYSVFYDSGPDTTQYITEDWWLARAYQALGGECWLDGEARLGHIGSKVYTAVSGINAALDAELDNELLRVKAGQ